jgi:hypothetical protein
LYSRNNISNFFLKSVESCDSISGQSSVNSDNGQKEGSCCKGNNKEESIEEIVSEEDLCGDDTDGGGSNEECKSSRSQAVKAKKKQTK